MKCQHEDCPDLAVKTMISQSISVHTQCVRLAAGQILDFDEEDGIPEIRHVCLFHGDPAAYHRIALDILKGV